MKSILIGLTLFSFTSSFAANMPKELEISKALAKAELATNLWYCDDETALKELAESVGIKNSLGCERAIRKAKLSLETSEITRIIDQHIDQLEQIELFETEVKEGKGYLQLIPSVKVLKANGVSLDLVRRYLQLTDGEMLAVELSFEKSKSDLERVLENI